MSVVNLPPILRVMWNELEARVRKLETAQIFQAPPLAVNPIVLRDGMIWYRTDLDMYFTYANGAVRAIGEMRYYGSFFDTTTQSLGSTASVYAIALGTTDASNGVSITNGSEILIANAGVYNIQHSLQFDNSSAANLNADVFLRKNGVDVASSDGQVGIMPKKGAVNGTMIASWNYIVTAAAGDKFQLYWTAEATTVRIVTIPASVSPPHPSAPSVIVTVTQVAW